jgi:hypothetical protein
LIEFFRDGEVAEIDDVTSGIDQEVPPFGRVRRINGCVAEAISRQRSVVDGATEELDPVR